MNEDIKRKSRKAIGHFNLNANENDEGEALIPTSRLVMYMDSNLLYIAGYAGDAPNSQGGDVYISKKIEANTTYAFESGTVGGNYNPKHFEGQSWSSLAEDGEVTIEEVDLDKKTAKGSFKFTARSRDGQASAEIHGNFNLRE
ncbi:hypothetical protein PSH79_20975 [Pseudomonas sp. FP2196]|uniref:hypothetical protein n=1 Tax=Pseudomonas sp. FP2196 TaxID=2954086 RepID=UPI0027370089|nr:hypothetical protein [Pseudomonas sp. FP2196]WLH34382.1 hypothetical protein PSH79_20975 [Pseudomonas sp. FP2196]